MSTFESIKKGLDEAFEFSKGHKLACLKPISPGV